MHTGHFQLESRWHSKSWLESQVFGDQNEFPFRGRAEAVFRLPRQPVKLFPTLPRNALLKEGSSSEPSFPHLPTHCVNRAVHAGTMTWWEISQCSRKMKKCPGHADWQVGFGCQMEKGKWVACCLYVERGQPWGPPAGRLRVTLCTIVLPLDTQLEEEVGGYFQLSKWDTCHPHSHSLSRGKCS